MTDGFATVPGVLSLDEVAALRDACPPAGEHRRGGIRNVLERSPQFRALACSAAVRGLVEPLLGRGAFAVRATLFDKTPDANWKVPWHQDLTIAVQRRVDTPGFSVWSVKDGVDHVQPPGEILEQMLAVRIHLDDCGADNGPLRVIRASHSLGRLADAGIEQAVASGDEVVCAVNAGGALLMRPLLVHASSASLRPARRRVLHIEYAAAELPNGLQWLAQVQ
jgi:ectoine hydroxylase-related dioxygenase (phytanoyl-CoA dioxygenase family)